MSKKLQVKILTLDTETIGLGGAIKRIAIYDGKEITYGYKFSDVEPKINELYEAGFSVHIYIHNLEFDMRKMPEIFYEGNINYNSSLAINGRYVTVRCKKYWLHDSFRLLPMSLKKISEGFEVEHGKLDLWEEVTKTYPNQYKDIDDFFRHCDKDDPLYVKYLGYDVMSLYEVLQKLIELTGMTETEFVKRPTTASLSKYLFRKGYKGHTFQYRPQRLTDFQMITKCKKWNSDRHKVNGKTYKYLEEFIRESYYGGRTEVFTPRLSPKTVDGIKQIMAYHYDVNSLYPSVMYPNKFPVGEPRFFSGNSALGCWEDWCSDKLGLGFVKAHVYIPEQTIPPLPSKKGKLVFLTGHVRGTWTFIELLYAVEHCNVEIKEIEEVVYFEETYPVFHDFIGTFYALKEEGKRTGNGALTQFAKLIQNVAYGYLALKRERDALRNIEDESKIDPKDIIYKNEHYGYIKIDTMVISDTVQPQIASYVTSYARLILLKALKAQAEKGTVYYCDTDSIVCDTPMSPDVVDPYKLGYWDLEGELYEGYFLQPKVYYESKKSGETIKFKGVSSSTSRNFTSDFYRDLYERLYQGEGGKVLVEKGKELMRSVNYGQKMHQDLNLIELRDKTMNLDAPQKRIMDYKNNTTHAWHMHTLSDFELLNLSIRVKAYSEFNNLFNTCL